MTETAPPPLTECVVPEGKSMTALTVGELDYASRQMDTDIINALATPTSPHRLMAMCWLAFLWTRRIRPTVKIAEFTAMEARDVQLILGLQRPKPEEAADPTPSGSGSSSPEPGESPTQTTS